MLDKLLGGLVNIPGILIDRLVPDKNKKQDQDHEVRTKQIDATIEGERNGSWTPRKILMMAFAAPVILQIVVKPVVEWASIVVGSPVTLPDIAGVSDALRILGALIGII